MNAEFAEKNAAYSAEINEVKKHLEAATDEKNRLATELKHSESRFEEILGEHEISQEGETQLRDEISALTNEICKTHLKDCDIGIKFIISVSKTEALQASEERCRKMETQFEEMEKGVKNLSEHKRAEELAVESNNRKMKALEKEMRDMFEALDEKNVQITKANEKIKVRQH